MNQRHVNWHTVVRRANNIGQGISIAGALGALPQPVPRDAVQLGTLPVGALFTHNSAHGKALVCRVTEHRGVLTADPTLSVHYVYVTGTLSGARYVGNTTYAVYPAVSLRKAA